VRIARLITFRSGGRVLSFNVLEDYNREVLAIEIDTSLTSLRLVRVFAQSEAERGLPAVLRTDSGPEFLGAELTQWCDDHGVKIDYFMSLDEVREITWNWMLEYNEERGQDALGKLTPVEFYQQARMSTLEMPT
jgi:putative transposase